jgi:hypothetical protein
MIDKVSYELAFLSTAIAGIATLIVLVLGVKDPRKKVKNKVISSPTN